MSNDLSSYGHKVVSKGYKYFMVFLCMLTQAIPYGIAQLIQPLFVHPLVNTFHFTLASYTLIFTFGAVVGSLVSPMVGKASQKVNFKILYLIGICLSAGAYVIFGISTKLPGFYLAGIICMVGSTFYSRDKVYHGLLTTGSQQKDVELLQELPSVVVLLVISFYNQQLKPF